MRGLELFRISWYQDDEYILSVVRAIATKARDQGLEDYVRNTDWDDLINIYEPDTRRLLDKTGSLGLHIPTLMDLVQNELNNS